MKEKYCFLVNMKKIKNKLLKTALAIVAGVVCLSCGSRKVNTQIDKQKEETKTSVLINEKTKDSIYTLNDEKLRLKLEKTNLNFEPIDNTRPYFVNGTKYENVKIVNKKENVDFSQENKQIKIELSQLERNTIILQEEIKELYKKNKKIERNNTVFSITIFVIILLLLLAVIYYFYKRYKNLL